MADFLVREANDDDNVARQTIIEAATHELRKTYQPRIMEHRDSPLPTGVLVALKQNRILGTLEYLINHKQIHLQGIAVHPDHRGQGICRSLITAAEEIAHKVKLNTISLRIIEETGNRIIFQKIGFRVVNRSIAQAYSSTTGGTVTQIEMERILS